MKKIQDTPVKLQPVSNGNGVCVTLPELLSLRHHAKDIQLNQFITVKTQLMGQRLSVMRGRGIDFSEVRIYQPGDDIRHMDWRVTARSGKPHTKLFQEERERPILTVVDYGPSMFFGTRVAFKSVIAAKLAALFAWAGIARGDRIGGFIFSGKQCDEIRPQAGTRGILPLCQHLANISTAPVNASQEGALTSCLQRVRRVTKPGSLIILISDFAGIDRQTEFSLAELKQHNDVMACFIYDPLEAEPPPPGYYTITNGEEKLSFDTRYEAVRKSYQHGFIAHQTYVEQTMRRFNIPFFTFRTDEEISTKLHLLQCQKKRLHEELVAWVE